MQAGRKDIVSRYPASWLSPTFWKSYFITMRPYLTFVSGSAGLAGLAFIPDPDLVRLLLAFIPLFLSYGLGQALTDCFQIDTDSISSPYRPMVKGIISPGQVLAVSLTGLALSISIIAYLNIILIAFGALVVAGLISYTKLKRTWWGGPPWNAWIVAVLPIMGRLTAKDIGIFNSGTLGSVFTPSFIFVIGAIFFGYANFVVMGYFKDIPADRETGYNTFPVVFGWQAAAIYSDITALMASLLTGLFLLSSDFFSPVAIAVYLIAITINTKAQIEIHKISDEGLAHGPITNVVRALILYCLAVILTVKPGWLPAVMIYYLAFEVFLKYRPEKTQV